MIKTPEAPATTTPPSPVGETEPQRYERILLRPQFKPLKAMFENLGMAVPLIQTAILGTNCFQQFLSKIGYGLVLVNQIHENDCYSRLGPKGGIRAVLPVHDIATYSTLVALVNYDATVTTTANSVDYYDDQLSEFKIQLMNRSGNAA